MRKIILALCCAAATSAVAVEPQGEADPPHRPIAERNVRVAQACGWYAIFHCSRNPGDAQRWANRNAGYVINTSSAAYPNFAPGWFCVVQGPMDYYAAVGLARQWQRSGLSPTAYAKNAC